MHGKVRNPESEPNQPPRGSEDFMDLVTQNYNGRLVEFRQEPASASLLLGRS